jgi:hopanoid biosynthesis associated protein HpnK
LQSVIFTADDFGLSEAVNQGIERAHRDGVLTHASLMVAGAAAEDAVSRARRLPGLNVGLHLVAVEGPAVLPPAQIPALLDADGKFPSDQLRLGLRYFFLPHVRRQLAAEIRAQFEAFAATGLPLSHADAHKHMHLHPTVGHLMLAIGKEFSLPRIRIPAEPPGIVQQCGVAPTLGARAMHAWCGVLRRQARAAGIAAGDSVFGLAWTGHMTEARVLALLPHLPDGLNELYFHPAARRDALLDALMPTYEHEAELAALLSPRVRQALAAFPASATASARTGTSTPACSRG